MNPIARLRPIYRDDDAIVIIDQTRLPHELRSLRVSDLAAVCEAIVTMRVRGAPLIGVAAAFGVALAMREDASDAALAVALRTLEATRPTAVNLRWALARMRSALESLPPASRAARAIALADEMLDEDIACNRAIGEAGLALLQGLPARPLNIMTHCNAGALATAGLGTALAPIYLAHAAGVPLHVWVSETRPRNQGLLTAWELAQAGVPHTLIADNAAGLLMQQARVDVVIVGADRIAANGDVANKVGTYLKALAAQAHGVPFYVAAPSSTFDAQCARGEDIPIEERAPSELTEIAARRPGGESVQASLCPPLTAHNPAFDVTPARLVSGVITEQGVLPPGVMPK